MIMGNLGYLGYVETSVFGLATVSPKISLVSGLMAFLKPSISFGSTKVVVIPNRGSVYSNRLCVPPYNA